VKLLCGGAIKGSASQSRRDRPGSRKQETENMQPIPKSDDEMLPESSESEVTDQEPKSVPWRKPLVIGLSATVVFALVVLMRKMPMGLNDMTQKGVISLAGTCSKRYSENCWETKCCQNPKDKCYTKNHYWASCKPSCDKNEQDAYDKENGITDGWMCIHPDEHAKVCSRDHDDCKEKTTCCSKDHICYVKHDTWSNCNDKCTQGVGSNPYDKNDKEGWTCEIHGLISGDGKTLAEGATPEDLLAACKTHYCPTGTDETKCLTEKCVFYDNLVKNKPTTAAPAGGDANTTAAPAPPTER